MSDQASQRHPTVAGYEIVREVGRGGFAIVFEAVQLTIGRPVALKVISLDEVGPGTARRFRAECRAIGRLSRHPHVVPLYDAGESDGGEPYLAMELCPDGSLGDRLDRESPLPVREAIQAGLDVADALSAAHDAGIIHRDIKPENLMIGYRGEVLLGDFGIATLADATSTATGSFVGSVAYSAPERIHGAKADISTDVYSLGATLHALLSGSPPFDAGPEASPAALIYQVLEQDPQPLPATVPDRLAAVVRRAMNRDPTQRFTSAADLADGLRAALDDLTDTDLLRGTNGGSAPPPHARPEEGAGPRITTPPGRRRPGAPTVALDDPTPPPLPPPLVDEDPSVSHEPDAPAPPGALIVDEDLGFDLGPHRGARAIIFAALVLLVLGGALLAVRWQDRDAWFIEATDDGTVAIFRGQPDGGLLFGPEQVGAATTPLDELTAADQEIVASVPTFDSQADAQAAVERFDRQAQASPSDATDEPAGPLVAPSELTVTILNGSGRVGVAAQLTDLARTAGYQVLDPFNAAQDITTTVIYAPERFRAEAAALATVLGVPGAPVLSEPHGQDPEAVGNADLVVVTGADQP